MKVFEEEEWFEEFYPKEWGDWRKAYNIREFANQFASGKQISGCTWMDYSKTGGLMGEIDGTMEVIPHMADPECFESFFIESTKEFCQPYYQPKDNTHYLKVTAERMESNLDLYVIHVAGHDDCSYTRHCLSLSSMRKAIKDLKKHGTSTVEYSSNYFFSN